MEKNKEDGMTDLEIIDKATDRIDLKTMDCASEIIEIMNAATRMAAEIERLKAEIIEANKKAKDQGRTACNLFDELKKLQKENRELEAALAEKPDLRNIKRRVYQ